MSLENQEHTNISGINLPVDIDYMERIRATTFKIRFLSQKQIRPRAKREDSHIYRYVRESHSDDEIDDSNDNNESVKRDEKELEDLKAIFSRIDRKTLELLGFDNFKFPELSKPSNFIIPSIVVEAPKVSNNSDEFLTSKLSLVLKEEPKFYHGRVNPYSKSFSRFIVSLHVEEPNIPLIRIPISLTISHEPQKESQKEIEGFRIIAEPDNDEKLHVGTMKRYTGADYPDYSSAWHFYYRKALYIAAYRASVLDENNHIDSHQESKDYPIRPSEIEENNKINKDNEERDNNDYMNDQLGWDFCYQRMNYIASCRKSILDANNHIDNYRNSKDYPMRPSAIEKNNKINKEIEERAGSDYTKDQLNDIFLVMSQTECTFDEAVNSIFSLNN